MLSRANFDNDAQDEDEKGQKRDNHLTITPYPRYGILTSLHEREMGGGGVSMEVVCDKDALCVGTSTRVCANTVQK